MATDYSKMTDAELQAAFAAQSGGASQPTQILSPRQRPAAPPTPAEIRNAQFDPVKFSQDLTSAYKKDVAISNYEISLPQYVTALETQRLRKKATPSDDLQLLYIAAKIWDPGSVVRENEQQSIQNLQPTIQRIAQQFGKEVLGGGLFTDQGRKELMASLESKIKMQRAAYDAVRKDYALKAEQGKINPTLVIGTDYNKIYAQQLGAINKPVTPDATGIPKAPVTQEGARGSDVEGYRFSPQGMAQILSYIQKPGFTKEGYADVVSNVALQEGIVTPETVGQYRQDTLVEGGRLAKVNDAARAAITGFDYSKVDANATKNLGLLDAATQTVKNIPASAASLLYGIASLPIDVVKSITYQTPTGTTKVGIDIVKDLAAAAGMGDADGKTLSAVKDALSERYGGWDNVKRTLITDPVGFSADASILAGGTGAALKFGGLTKAGEALTAAGTKLDPLSFMVETARGTAPSVRQALSARVGSIPNVSETLGDITVTAAGFPSGVGGESLSALRQAGLTRPYGAPTTPAYEAAVAGMREPESVTRQTVNLATQSVRNLRNLASQEYKTARAQFGSQAQPINFDDIRQTVQDLRPENYGTYSRKNMPTSHRAWETMRDMVEDYASAIQKNPAKADPLAIDQFKKDLYERGSKVGGKFDTDSARIAREAYQGVRQKLIEADPLYEQMMKNYEAAQDELFQLENTFSLGGKQVRSDTANRKLLSIMRNDASTNYGDRLASAMRLAQLDPTGQLIPMLGGQMASSWTPRGISGLTAGGAYGASTLFGVPLTAKALIGLPTLSPRFMGEAALASGRLQASIPSLRKLADAYSASPAIRASLLAAGQAGAGAQNVEQDLINADLSTILAPQGRR